MKNENCCFDVDDVPHVILERHGVKPYLQTVLLFKHLLENGDNGYFTRYEIDDFPPGFGLLGELEEKGIIEKDVGNGVFIRVKKEIHIEHLKLAAEAQGIEILDMSDYIKELDEAFKE